MRKKPESGQPTKIVDNPSIILKFIQRYSQTLGFHIFDVVSRLVLGVALLVAADGSRYSAILFFIGMLLIAVAIFLAAIGRSNFKILTVRISGMKATTARISGVSTVLFAGFFVYAVL